MILLTCDHKRRELASLKKLKLTLENKGIKVKIINKHLAVKAYNLYKPKIITIPHCNNYLFDTVKNLHKKVKLIVLPSESAIFVDKFIEMIFLNKFENYSRKSNHNKTDLIFTHSEHTSKILKKKNSVKPDLCSSGFIHYEYWNNNKYKNSNKYKNIGIALTLINPFMYYKNKSFLVNYHHISEEIKYFKNPWRINEITLGLYYNTIIFEILKNLPKNYKINIRLHPLDFDFNWKKIFKNKKNISIDTQSEISEWINNQDLIISTFSAINIDSYVFKKPHISLINMIPKHILNYSAYDAFSVKDYKETYSYKPKNMKELIKIVKRAKFKKNLIMSKKLEKYYKFPYKISPVNAVANELEKQYKNTSYSFSPVKINKNNIAKYFYYFPFLYFYLSEIKIFFNRFNQGGYFSSFTRIFFSIPRYIYSIFRK